MIHPILRKLILIAVLLTGSHAFAHDFEVDGIYYNILSSTDKTVEVTYRGSHHAEYTDEYTGSIVIPESIIHNGTVYSVTAISDYAFYYSFSLTSLTIGNSVTTIGDWAFSECRNLNSLTILDSVTTIGGDAFSGCINLTSLTIPNSVTSIGDSAFMNCFCLTSLIIGNSVTSIGNKAFYGCSSLTSVTIPDNVTAINSRTFAYCSSLASLTIGNSVTNIGEYAFYDCYALTSLTSLNPIPPICGNNVFYGVHTQHIPLYVPQESVPQYQTTDTWMNFQNIIGKDFSGVEETLGHNEVNVSIENGNIVIGGTKNAPIEVYSTSGQCVYSGTATSIPVSTKGLYVVKVNGKSFKVIL